MYKNININKYNDKYIFLSISEGNCPSPLQASYDKI